MNTIKSFWIGWGSLCVAGGGAYYFAKKSINADRQAKLEAHRKKMHSIEQMQYSSGGPARTDSTGSPGQEVGSDPAPTRHAPTTEGQRVGEKSKFEGDTVYKNPKGNRFS